MASGMCTWDVVLACANGKLGAGKVCFSSKEGDGRVNEILS
jgi:hypothetical protein